MSASPTPLDATPPPDPSVAAASPEPGAVAMTAARWAWHLATGTALLASPVVLAADAARGRGAVPTLERLGMSPRLADRPAWIHAASVGELSVAGPLVRSLRAARPDVPLALSTMTATGRAVAARLEDKLAAPPFHVPADAAPCVAAALARLAPRAFVSIETELWPNLWRACAARGIPVALVNGRISERHFPSYVRARALILPALRSARVLAMRSREDADRALALGAAPGRVVVTGDIKFDAALALRDEAPIPWAGDAGLDAGPWLFLCSTAEGEEGPLLDAFARLRTRVPQLRCLLAPRKRERWDGVAAMVEARGLPLARRSSRREGERVAAGGILLLDSLGELARLYRHAALAFVGGSLVPHGGQSLVEPAAAGRPVLFGPHVENFRDAREALISSGGGKTVTMATFEESCATLLADAGSREAMGRQALEAVRLSEGATARSVELLLPLLVPGGSR